MKRLMLMMALLPALAMADASVASDAAASGPVLLAKHYQCAGKRTLVVEYPEDGVSDVVPIRVHWKGVGYRLARVTGDRYVSQQLVWWRKGDEATLTTRGGRVLVRECRAEAAE
ncbi:MliC family protein [uncultured Aquitalea sp.]|uniref:MliC family protein n=1 Tax=uncultured Aquitalea sp. TaxID=540272 RepID=UPI0025D3545D|nr:MliC family protein [uncultured Aquitalea sp.]